MDEFTLISLEEVGGGPSCLLRAPCSLSHDHHTSQGVENVFNILMADASGSMEERWPRVVHGWEKHVVPKLDGRTKIYIFDSEVRFMRSDKHILQRDFTGHATNLVSAMETIMKELEECAEWKIRVFLLTDGHHNHDFQGREPGPIIEQMKPPPGKTVCVYLLGIGVEFPVNYSVDIRSRLHNSNSNVPTLFWAKEDKEIVGQLQAISLEISENLVSFELDVEGYILPGLEVTSKICLGEWLYISQSIKDIPFFTAQLHDKEKKIVIPKIMEIDPHTLVDEVFRQWNSILIQQHRIKSYIPYETFDLMKSLYDGTMGKEEVSSKDSKTLRSRLSSSWKRTYDLKFRTLLNKSKNIISLENKFKDELELAESVLKTTVTAKKYFDFNLRFKGHGQTEFEADAQEFLKLYNEAKHEIMALPDPKPEDCCAILGSSTLMDLQDPDFPLLLRESKFNFLKVFSLTGLAAYAPIKNASQINPWTLSIRSFARFPYCTLSQVAYEYFVENTKDRVDSTQKKVLLHTDDESTACNIIIPLVPASAANVLKPLINSNLYSMMATFCILKSPHIIDHNAHIAALSCAWFSTIRNFPNSDKPEYIQRRIKDIKATASVYAKKPSIRNYIKALLEDPDQALMTESTKEFNGQTTNCESLIKPMFFLYLVKNRLSLAQKEHMLKLLLAEFVGRTLPKYSTQTRANPYTKWFGEDTYKPEHATDWMISNYKPIVKALKPQGNTLLQNFFILQDLEENIRWQIKNKAPALTSSFINMNKLMKRVKSLKNIGSCGDVKIADFQCWAQEMSIPESSIKKATTVRQVAVYVCEGLATKSSRDRTSKATMAKTEAEAIIHMKVNYESTRHLKSQLFDQIKKVAFDQWRAEYSKAHRDIVMPMTPEQIIQAAQEKNIPVTQDSFSQYYRYDDRMQLLRNACQIRKCPHFLQPRSDFSQHLIIERQEANFPHALHLVAKKFGTEGIDSVAERLQNRELSGTCSRKLPTPPDDMSLTDLKERIKPLLKHYHGNRVSEKVSDVVTVTPHR